MNTDAFYQTVAGLCFTLLGLWWAIVQFRHDEWMFDLPHRRVAYSVHLSFLVPGIMSLGAMTMGDVKLIWRLVFISASVFGLAAMLFLITSGMPALGGRLVPLGRWLSVLLYALITIVAAAPNLSQLLAPELKPLQVEGLLLTLLVFLGASLAWSLLMAPKQNT
jgi:hypothetical protein